MMCMSAGWSHGCFALVSKMLWWGYLSALTLFPSLLSSVLHAR